MKLTEKCKEEFEKWFVKDIDIDEDEFFNNDTMLYLFYAERESMQYGVYVDFFDSVEIQGKKLFSTVFKRYYEDKTDDFTHNDIVENSIITSNELYNDWN